MTYAANPFAQLKDLYHGYPQEPFLDLPRRPNRYRDKPEYQEWEQGVRDQDRRILYWYKENLRLCSPERNALRLELAGRPVPGFTLRKQPDGTIRLDREFSRKMYPELDPADLPEGWTRPLEVPGPGADTAGFLQNNHTRNDSDKVWDLHDRLKAAAPPSALAQPYGWLPGHNLPAVKRHIYQVLESFVDEARQFLEPEPFRLLNRLYGGSPTSYWTLLEYNLAVQSGPVLTQAAQANPGAVACWLDHFHTYITPPTRYYPPDTPPEKKAPPPAPIPMPQHPGAVVGPVKAQFEQLGGQGWKTFARQPAGHIHRQLHRDRTRNTGLPYMEMSNGDIARWLNGRLHAANLNGLRRPSAEPEPTAAPAQPEPPVPAAPIPDPQVPTRQQLCLLDQSQPQPKPETPAPPPAGPPPQPPLFLKLLLPELRFARKSPGDDRNQRRAQLGMAAQGAMAAAAAADPDTAAPALDHLVTLALRHYAGHPELKAKSPEYRELKAHLQDLADYCWAEPTAAQQAKTFTGLGKASHRWHHETVLREIAAQLAAEQEANEKPWSVPCPLHHYQEDRWLAQFLTCPADLQEESIIMRHCVGGNRYRRDSEYGDCRIYHLQPRPPRAKGDWSPDSAQRRQSGTTLELVNGAPPGQPIRWRPGQHRGYYNRAPTEAEEAFAERLAAALNAAESQAALAAAGR